MATHFQYKFLPMRVNSQFFFKSCKSQQIYFWFHLTKCLISLLGHLPEVDNGTALSKKPTLKYLSKFFQIFMKLQIMKIETKSSSVAW